MIINFDGRNKMQDQKKEIDFFKALTEGEYDTIPTNSFNYIYTELNKLSLHGSILEAGCGRAAFRRKLIERNQDYMNLLS